MNLFLKYVIPASTLSLRVRHSCESRNPVRNPNAQQFRLSATLLRSCKYVIPAKAGIPASTSFLRKQESLRIRHSCESRNPVRNPNAQQFRLSATLLRSCKYVIPAKAGIPASTSFLRKQESLRIRHSCESRNPVRNPNVQQFRLSATLLRSCKYVIPAKAGIPLYKAFFRGV